MTWNDEKEIRRYYNFNYLLNPAPTLERSELEQFAYNLGEKTCKNVMIKSIVNSMLISNDIVYAKKPHGSVVFNATELAIDIATRGLQEKNIPAIYKELVMAMATQPNVSELYGHLFDFEMDMLRRKTFSEPKKVKT